MSSQAHKTILTTSNGHIVADSLQVARTFFQQLVGLIGKREFPRGSALIIPGCRQAHTFFMRFPIDMVFLDANDRVLSVEHRIVPYSTTGYYRNARKVLELPEGTCAELALAPGDLLVMKEA